MNALKREMERKRKALLAAKEEATGGFIKAGELRRLEDEQEHAKREEKLQQHQQHQQPAARTVGNEQEDETQPLSKRHRADPKRLMDETVATTNQPNEAKESNCVEGNSKGKKKKENELGGRREVKQLSTAEITRKLRLLGLPVRLFGELADENRQTRLNQAMEGHAMSMLGKSERQEFQLEKGHRIRNPFLEKEESSEQQHQHQNNKSGTNSNQEAAKNVDETTPDNIDDDEHLKILKYLKGLLADWERVLAARPDPVKQTVAGKNETKTLRQCRDYIQPLFKACQKRQLEPGMLAHLSKIVKFAKLGEFVKAHDAYLDVAIGRAAWPIGVTMVGIHARTGRAKIESANVAHVMNSELQRKYLTSIKRLLTFAQTQRTDVDPSKKVM